MPSIAIIGASRDVNKISHQAVIQTKVACWDVYPVNPHATMIADCDTVATIADVPAQVDVVSFYVPPASTTAQLESVKNHAPQAVVIFNPGSADDATRAKAETLGLSYREICTLTSLQQLTIEFSQH